MVERAVIYSRYSSDKQNEQSCEEQVQKCSAYCVFKKYEIVGIYSDKAKSGSKNLEKRIEFLRMIEDAKKHKFDVLVVYKLDRFSRNEFDTKEYEKILLDNNVRLESATENYDPNTVEGFILKSVLQMVAQIMPKQLSPRVLDGMNMNADKCLSIGGIRKFGYNIVDKKFEVNEDEAKVVRLIFDLYNKGYSFTSLARYLNEHNYSFRGKKFTNKSFYKLLTDEFYIGTYTLMNHHTENGVPSIVDKDVFSKTQELLKSKLTTYNRVNDYYLSGKLFYYDNKMVGTGGTGKSKVYKYYEYKGNRIRKDFIEEQVLSTITDFLSNNLETIACEMEEFSKTKSNKPEIDRLTKELKENERAISSLLKLSRVTYNEYIAEEIDATYKKIDAIKSMIKYLESTNKIITKEMTIAFLSEFILTHDSSDTFKRKLFNLLVQRVDITDSLKIYLNLPEKNEHIKCSYKSFMVVQKSTFKNIFILM